MSYLVLYQDWMKVRESGEAEERVYYVSGEFNAFSEVVTQHTSQCQEHGV